MFHFVLLFFHFFLVIEFYCFSQKICFIKLYPFSISFSLCFFKLMGQEQNRCLTTIWEAYECTISGKSLCSMSSLYTCFSMLDHTIRKAYNKNAMKKKMPWKLVLLSSMNLFPNPQLFACSLLCVLWHSSVAVTFWVLIIVNLSSLCQAWISVYSFVPATEHAFSKYLWINKCGFFLANVCCKHSSFNMTALHFSYYTCLNLSENLLSI